MEYSSEVKNRRLQVVNDAIGADGLLKIGTAGMGTVLSVVRLSSPAFREPVDGVMDLAGAFNSDQNAAASGKAREAQITTASGRVVIDKMSVGEKDAAIIITSDEIKQGQEIQVVSGAIAHA